MDYEAKLQEFYEKMINQGMTAIDVGAHTGRHTFEIARLVSPNGCVFAFEPAPDTYKYLKEKVELRLDMEKIIRAYPYALYNSNGVVDFCFIVDNPGYSGILERTYDTPSRIQHIKVECFRLDDFFDDKIFIHYIKIDAEGAEWNVIQGAEKTIKRCRPFISFEFGENSFKNYNVRTDEVFEFFEKNKYVIYDINGKQLGKSMFSESTIHQAVWDYFAIPYEKGDKALQVFKSMNNKTEK